MVETYCSNCYSFENEIQTSLGFHLKLEHFEEPTENLKNENEAISYGGDDDKHFDMNCDISHSQVTRLVDCILINPLDTLHLYYH